MIGVCFPLKHPNISPLLTGSHFLWGSWIYDQCTHCKYHKVSVESFCRHFFFFKKLNVKCFVYQSQDSFVVERLIEKCMSLPNQAWDNIVKEATRVS